MTEMAPEHACQKNDLSAAENIKSFLWLTHRGGGRLFISGRFGRNGEWQDRPFDDHAAAARFCVEQRETHDVYYSTNIFAPACKQRLGDNVIGSYTLRLEIDVDPDEVVESAEKRKTYRSLPDAVAAVTWFTKQFLPFSLPIGSGNGLHAYWLTHELMPVAVWEQLSVKLKTLTQRLGLLFDHQCTADKARVLRPTSTFNHNRKHPERGRVPVAVLAKGAKAFTVAELDKALDDALAKLGDAPVPSPRRRRATLKQATERPETTEETATKFRRSGGLNPLAFCPQLAKSHAEHGKHDGYVVWRCCLQFAKAHSDDPSEQLDLAIRFSDGHPEFDGDEVADKLKGLHSPPLCTTFDEARPGICPSCRSWGRIASPISMRIHEVVHTPERKRAIDDEIDQFRTVYASTLASGPPTALAEIEHRLVDLKARDPELARDCAHRLMVLIHKWEWPEHAATTAGITAGLDEVRAAGWAAKLYRVHSVTPGQKNASPADTGR